MNTKEVFHSAFPELVTCLPIKDAIFKAKLKKEGLFPGNLEAKVDAKDTNADGATMFLNEGIQPFLDFEEKCQLFRKLLSVMESSGPALKELAIKIKKQLNCKYCDAYIAKYI